MKIKCRPDDFIVEEIPGLPEDSRGNFRVYRLEKTGWTTPDALAFIRRAWDIKPTRMGYGGLKDRHAKTIQYFTIHGGPESKIQQPGIEAFPVASAREPFHSRHIVANRFTVVARAIDLATLPILENALKNISQFGIPNYFDDQRFGSVSGPGQPFIGKFLCAGNFEDALREALAGRYTHDKPEAKREKQILRDGWGDWKGLKESLPRGHARSLVCYLMDHPTDFRGAVARLRPELGGLYLAAYQSWIWNKVLDARIRQDCHQSISELPCRLRSWAAPGPGIAAPAFDGLSIPLPSARLKLPAENPWLGAFNSILAEDGLTLATMKVPRQRDLFFSKGERNGWLMPTELTWRHHKDDYHHGALALAMSFLLPRGSYATMLIKRLQAAAGSTDRLPDEDDWEEVPRQTGD